MKRLSFIALVCTLTLGPMGFGQTPEDSSKDSPISALTTLLEAQNQSDLKKALSVTRGQAAKTVAPSLANFSRMGIQYDTKKIPVKKSEEAGEFTILTVQVSAGRDGKTRSRDMIAVGTKIEGKWVITFLDDDSEKPEKSDYENTDELPLEEAEKELAMWKERLSKLPK